MPSVAGQSSVHRCTDTPRRRCHAGGARRSVSNDTTSDVSRYAIRPRSASFRRRKSVDPHLVRSTAGPPKDPVARNQILHQLPTADRNALLFEGGYIGLAIGQTIARMGDLISWAYFPDDGFISLISEMTTGHQVAVAGKRIRFVELAG